MPTLTNAVFHSNEAGKPSKFLAAFNTLAEKSDSVAVAMKIRRVRRVITPQAKDVEDTRADLIRRNGVEIEPGIFSVEAGTEGYAAYMRDYLELMAQEFEVPDAFTPADLPSFEGVATVAEDLGPLLLDE